MTLVEPEKFSLKDFKVIFSFDVRFWLVTTLVCSYYAGVIPFIAMLAGWLQSKYGYDVSTAGNFSSIVILASMILSPFLGKLVDKVGNRPLVAICGSALILVGKKKRKKKKMHTNFLFIFSLFFLAKACTLCVGIQRS